jgi:MFS family permease
MPLLPEGEKTPLRELFRAKFFVAALLLMVCSGASELTMSQWSSFFAEKGLGVPKLAGDLLGPCLFAVFMGSGRAIYGVFGRRIPLKGALLASGALCVACYATTVFAPWPILSLLGCALCGFSVSLMWPGTFSLSSAAFPKGGTAMFGLLAVCGDLGASLGPWLAGFAADLAGPGSAGASETFGLKVGLSAAAIFPIVLVILVAASRRPRAVALATSPEEVS